MISAMTMPAMPQMTMAPMPMAMAVMTGNVPVSMLVPVTAVTTVVAVNCNNAPLPSAPPSAPPSALPSALPSACSLDSIGSRPSSGSFDEASSFSRSVSESTESELSLSDDGCVAGRVWDLSQRTKGCRQVQLSLEDPTMSDAARNALALELRGKEPEEVSNLAKHQYACRILQRWGPWGPGQEWRQHVHGRCSGLLENCTEAQRQALGEILLGNGLGALGNDENATQVLQKALVNAPQKAIAELCILIGQEPLANSLAPTAILFMEHPTLWYLEAGSPCWGSSLALLCFGGHIGTETDTTICANCSGTSQPSDSAGGPTGIATAGDWVLGTTWGPPGNTKDWGPSRSFKGKPLL
eukprot:Skav212527  [mRNA]  locus=scaffold3442:55410:59459:+ [translate_table: standard]